MNDMSNNITHINHINHININHINDSSIDTLMGRLIELPLVRHETTSVKQAKDSDSKGSYGVLNRNNKFINKK
tara:strand:- start:1335 stop:1553 length:219 start_codon:yes stop_codon:yes gene_type:complete